MKNIHHQNLPQLIIEKSGMLTFPEINLILNPKTLTPKQCRIALQAYKNDDERDVGTGYYWQYYKILFESYPTYLSFCFYGTQCEQISLAVSLPTDQYQDNWLTEESMNNAIKFFNKAFKKQFDGKLGYGSVYNVFDPRSYSASTGISYKVKKLDYAVNMRRERNEFVDFADINAQGIKAYTIFGMTKQNVLVDNNSYGHIDKKCLSEQECLAETLKMIQEYKNKGYKITKETGKAIAYDTIDEKEL